MKTGNSGMIQADVVLRRAPQAGDGLSELTLLDSVLTFEREPTEHEPTPSFGWLYS